MKCYIITYDLKNESGTRDYEILYRAIKSYKTWARINDSTWAIVTDQSAANIRDVLMQYMDQNDSIFVVKSGLEAAWRNVQCSGEWLKKNL